MPRTAIGHLAFIFGAIAGVAACGPGEHAPPRDSATVARAAPPDTTAQSRRILFVGTSLTAGQGLDPDSAFSALIQRKIDSAGLPYETVNAGVSGETSAGLIERLDWVLRAKFDVIVIETGANDGLRGVKPTALAANLRTILGRVKAAKPGALVLLVRMEALPNYGRDYGQQFRAVYPAVAKEMGVTLLPFLLNGVAGHADLNQGDGVHPNYRGERMVAATLWTAMEPLLRERARR